MTEREKKNEEMKAQIRREAEVVCEYIDAMESQLKAQERMAQTLSEELDRQLQPV